MAPSGEDPVAESGCPPGTPGRTFLIPNEIPRPFFEHITYVVVTKIKMTID